MLSEINATLTRYKVLFENANDAIAILDSLGKYFEHNKEFTRLFGYSERELRGKTPAVHLGEKFFRTVARHLANFPSFRGELTTRTKDGKRLDVELSAFPVLDDDNNVVCYVEIYRDISKRKRIERALKESEEKYRTLVERMQDVVFVVQDGKVKFINQAGARMLGYEAPECIGMPLDKLIAPEDRSWLLELHSRRMAGDDVTKEYELCLLHKDGNTRLHVSINVGLINYEGKPAAMGTAKDITAYKKAEEERRKMEERLREAQKQESLGVMAGGIAHDFNNIITGILGNSDLALMKLPEDNPARKNIESIARISKKAAVLTNQMLAYSGKGRYMVHTLDLNQQVKELTEFMKAAMSKKVRLVYELAAALPLVQADSNYIKQIILNLVVNGSEALEGEEGEIIVRTGLLESGEAPKEHDFIYGEIRPDEVYVFLEVTDNGRGMDKATLPKIFDPFFTTKFTGRGLGLAAVLGVVRSHEGIITVRSRPSLGTTFTVFLPVKKDISAVNIVEESLNKGGVSVKGTVMIVDDEEMIRVLAKEFLDGCGFNVITAEDGRNALKIVEEDLEQIDVIIMDLTMPHMDGVETAKNIHEIRPDIPIFLSSGYSEEDLYEKANQLKLARFIKKPYTPALLAQKIIKVLAERR